MPFDEEPDDIGFPPPLPPEDRLWRHPSELAGPRPPASGPAVRRRADHRPAPRTWLVVAASVALGAGTTLVALAATGALDDGAPVTAVEQVQIPVPSNPSSSDLAVGEAVHPSIARIEATGPLGTRSGTAVVVRSDGHLLTTADAVDGADAITVAFADGSTHPAQLVGIDRLDDVAVVHVDRTDLTPATLGVASTPALGDRVVALAAGDRWPDERVVGVGAVTGMGQHVEVAGAANLHGMIEASVSRTSGATGAALVDTSGAVIGLLTTRGVDDSARSRTRSGSTLQIRYATPVAWAKHLADQLMADGRVSTVWLGVEGTEAAPAEVDRLGGRGGAKLTRVTDTSPAAEAGLQPGDIITSVDGTAVTSMSELITTLRPHAPGDTVAIGFDRTGEPQAAEATLAAKSGAQG